MAFADLGSLGSTGSTSNNQSSLVLTTTAAVAVGDFVVVVVAVDNRVTGGGDDLAVSGVTNSGTANTWTKAIQVANNLAAQGGASVSIWYTKATAAIASGGTITATFTTNSTSDATAMTARKFSVATGASVILEGTPTTLLHNTAADPGSLDLTTANTACLRIRACAIELGTNTNWTPTASWTAFAGGTSSTTGTTIEMSARAEFRIFTGTNAASDPTQSSAINANAYVAFKEVFVLAPALLTVASPAVGWSGSQAEVTLTNFTRTIDATAGPPSGGAGDLLANNTASSVIHQAVAVPNPVLPGGVTHTAWIEAKAGPGTSWCEFRINTNAGWFNLTTGVAGTQSGSFSASGIISLGSSWYRIWAQSFNASPPNYSILTASGDNASSTFADTIGDGIYVSRHDINSSGLLGADFPVFQQNNILVPSSLAVAALAIGAPAFSVPPPAAFTVGTFTTLSPAATYTFDYTAALTASALTVQSPVLDAPALSGAAEEHTLVASSLSVGTGIVLYNGSAANIDQPLGNVAGRYEGQSFTENISSLHSISFRLRIGDNSPTNGLYVTVLGVDGSGFPTGAVLGTSDTVDYTQILSTYSYIKFNFSNPVALTPSVKYVAQIHRLIPDASNYWQIHQSESSEYAGGTAIHFNGTAWTNRGGDCVTLLNDGIRIDRPAFFSAANTDNLSASSLSVGTGIVLYDGSQFNGNLAFGNAEGRYIGQSFTENISNLTSISFRFNIAYGTPTNGLYVTVLAADGSGFPTGSVLGTSNIVDYTQIGSSYSKIKFTFASAPTLTPGVKYVARVHRWIDDSSNYWQSEQSSSSQYAGGTAMFFNSVVWLNHSGDHVSTLNEGVYVGAGTLFQQNNFTAKPLNILRTNLIKQSQEIETASWARTNIVVTSDNLTAPDSTSTADLITDTGTFGGHNFIQNLVPVTEAGNHTFSIYVKAGTLPWIRLQIAGQTNIYRVNFNVSTGAVGLAANVVGTGLSTYGAISVGDGWYRLYVTGIPDPGPTFCYVLLLNSDSSASSYVGTGSTVYVWGAQLEQGDATAYIPTTTDAASADVNFIPVLGAPGLNSAVLDLVAASLTVTSPVFDTPVITQFYTHALLGAPLGAVRTNLIIQSQAIAATGWATSNATVTSDDLTAPDSTTTADRIDDGAAFSGHYVYQSTTTEAEACTFSAYVKPGTLQWIRLQIIGTSAAYRVNFNVSTGAIGIVASIFGTGPSAYGAVSVGDGWYRIYVTGTPGAGSTTCYVYLMAADTIATSHTGTNAYLHVWGVQLEKSATATAYIPTTTTPVTVGPSPVLGTPVFAERHRLLPTSFGPRLNLFKESQTFETAIWQPLYVTVTVDDITAPDSTLTADRITDTTDNNAHGFSQIPHAANYAPGKYTFSIYAKAGTLSWIRVLINSTAGNNHQTFNVSTGTIGNVTGVVDLARITDVGSGWYRCEVTSSIGTTPTIYVLLIPDEPYLSYTGTGKNLYLWGAQLEPNAAATAYIPTTTLPVAVGSTLAIDAPAFIENTLGALLGANLTVQSPVLDAPALTQQHDLAAANLAVQPLAFTAPALTHHCIFIGGSSHQIAIGYNTALFLSPPTISGIAQSFTVSGRLASVSLYVTKSGIPTGTITAKIFLASGSHLPTGTQVGSTASINSASIAEEPTLTTFVFPSIIELSPAVEYALVIEQSVEGGGYNIDVRSGDVYPAGTLSRNLSSTWTVFAGSDFRGYLTFDIVGSPTLGTPAVGQNHILMAATLAVQPLAINSPVIGQTGVMVAVPLAVQPLAFTAPSIAQKHTVIAAPLAAQPLAFTAATFTQKQVVAAVNLAVQPLAFTAPAIGQKHTVIATPLAVQPLAINSPVIGQTGVMVAVPLAVQPLAFTVATFSQKNVLIASPLAVQPLAFTAATFSQKNVLLASPLAVQPLAFTAVTFSQNQTLSAALLAVQPLAFTVPAIGQKHAVLAAPLAVQPLAFTAPAIGQKHVLPVTHFTTTALILPAANLGQAGVMAAAHLAASPLVLGAPALGQKHVLAAATLATQPLVLGTPSTFAPVTLSILGLNQLSPSLIGGAPTLTLVSSGTYTLTAAALTVTSPVLASVNMGITGQMAAAHLIVSSPIFGIPAISQKHALIASNKTVSSPVFASVNMGVTGQMAAVHLTVSSPIFGAPAIAQRHTLVASNKTVSSPAFSAANMGVAGQIAAVSIQVLSPVLNAPVFKQAHKFVINPFVVTSPVLGAPAMGRVLSASNLSTSSVLVGAPVFTGKVTLPVPLPLVVSSLQLGAPTFLQKHGLIAAPKTVSSPVLNAGILLRIVNCIAASKTVLSPVFGAPLFKQRHTLQAAALTVASPVLPAINAGQAGIVAAAHFTIGSPAFTAPALVQSHRLAGASLTIIGHPVLSNGVLNQNHQLVSLGKTTASPVLGTPALVQRQVLAAVSIATTSPTLATMALQQRHRLLGGHLHVSGPVLPTPDVDHIAQIYDLVAASKSVSSPTASAVTLKQKHVLIPSGMVVSAVSLGRPIVFQVPPFDLTAAAMATTSPTASAITLKQRHALTATALVGSAVSIGTTELDQRHLLAAARLSPVAVVVGMALLKQKHILNAANLVTHSPVIPVVSQVVHLLANNLVTSSPVITVPQGAAPAPFVAMLLGRQSTVTELLGRASTLVQLKGRIEMSTMKFQRVEMWRGDSRTIRFTITDAVGDDLTGASARWAMASSFDSIVIVEKLSIDGGCIIVGNIIDVNLDPEDTIDLNYGTYYHELRIIKASGAVVTASSGEFTLMGDLPLNTGTETFIASMHVTSPSIGAPSFTVN